jgi:hypothetical protein
MLFVNFLCSDHVYSSDPSKPEVVLVHVAFNWYNFNPSTNIMCVTSPDPMQTFIICPDIC